MKKILTLCILLISFTGSAFAQEIGKEKIDKAIKEANKVFEKTYPDIFAKYCKWQTPETKLYKIDYGECKGLEIIAVTYYYPGKEKQEDNPLYGLALSANVISKTGNVVTTWLGPDMLGIVHDKEANKCLSVPKKDKK